MNRKFFYFTLITVLSLYANTLWAFVVDNINYSIISNDDKTVAVESNHYINEDAVPDVVTIPETVNYNGETYKVTTIGLWGLNGLKKCKELRLPKTLRTIAEGFFSAGPKSLETIKMDEANPYFTVEDNILYNKDKTLLLMFPENAPSRTSLTIPSSVKRIANYAIKSNVKTIVLNEGLEEIGYMGILYVAQSEITLPSTLRKIDEYSFNCSTVKTVYSKCMIPPSISKFTFNNNYTSQQNEVKVYVPQGTKKMYADAEYWSNFKNNIEEDPNLGIVGDFTEYDVSICGVPINNFTKDNVANSMLKRGNISYDPDTRTLTLDNVYMRGTCDYPLIHSRGTGGLKLRLIGYNIIVSENHICILSNGDLTIDKVGGSGLHAPQRKTNMISGNPPSYQNSYHLYCYAYNIGIDLSKPGTLTINGCDVYSKGETNSGIFGDTNRWGTTCNSTLVANNCVIRAYGPNGAIRYFSDVQLNGCEITTPDAEFVEGDFAIMLDGEEAPEVEIEPVTVGYRPMGILGDVDCSNIEGADPSTTDVTALYNVIFGTDYSTYRPLCDIDMNMQINTSDVTALYNIIFGTSQFSDDMKFSTWEVYNLEMQYDGGSNMSVDIPSPMYMSGARMVVRFVDKHNMELLAIHPVSGEVIQSTPLYYYKRPDGDIFFRPAEDKSISGSGENKAYVTNGGSENAILNIMVDGSYLGMPGKLTGKAKVLMVY